MFTICFLPAQRALAALPCTLYNKVACTKHRRRLFLTRIGLIGIGMIAENYIRLITGGAVQGANITALSSRNTVRMQEVAQRYKLDDAVCFPSAQALLESGKVDAVIICTPHFQHAALALAALRQGLHVLAEKPVAVFGDEAAQLVAESERHPHLVCSVAYCNRATAPYRKVKELLDSGTLGRLKRAVWQITNLYRTEAYHASSAWRGTYQGEGGGILLNQASHQLDLYLWFCGMPSTAFGFCNEGVERAIETENDVTAYFTFSNGGSGQFITASHEFPGSNRLELSADKAQLILDSERVLTLRTLETPESIYAKTTSATFGSIPYKEEQFTFEMPTADENWTLMLQNFVDAVHGKAAPLCTVQEAAQSIALINALYLSSWTGKPQPLPPDAAAFRTALESRF